MYASHRCRWTPHFLPFGQVVRNLCLFVNHHKRQLLGRRATYSLRCTYTLHIKLYLRLCALGYLMYPSRILHRKFSSLVNISHKVWMILIAWTSSCLLSASDNTLSQSSLWIKSTCISAKVSCHRNGLALTCACVSKYFKDTLSM